MTHRIDIKASLAGRVLLGCFILTVAILSSGADDTNIVNSIVQNNPDKQATLEFISNTFAAYGTVNFNYTFTGIGQETDYHTYAFRTTNGMAQIRDTYTIWRHGGFEDWNSMARKGAATDDFRFSLSAIDPSTIKVERATHIHGDTWDEDFATKEGDPPFSITIQTTDNKPVITASRHTHVNDDATEQTNVTAIIVYLSNQQMAERLAKALSHAATLNGGKPSAF